MLRQLGSIALLLCCSAASAQVAVSSFSPGAVAPGKTTEITLTGQKFEDPLAIWTSFPAKVELVPLDPAQPTLRKVKLTLEESVPLAIGGLAVAGSGAVVPPLFLMVDDLPSIAETANNAPATPQDLTLPVAVDATISGPVSDFYRLTLAANQKIAIEIVGARLGSDLDAVLRVLDANGKQLALADDDDSTGADPRLIF